MSEVSFSPGPKGGKGHSEVWVGMSLDGDHGGAEVWWQKGWEATPPCGSVRGIWEDFVGRSGAGLCLGTLSCQNFFLCPGGFGDQGTDRT